MIFLLVLWSSSAFKTLQSSERTVVPFILQELNESPLVIIDNSCPFPVKTNEKCNHYTCFDVYRCEERHSSFFEDKISVYIYPLENYVDSNQVPISSPISQEFWELLEAIYNSPYYTSDPYKACLLMPSLDLLNQNYVRLEETSQILASLPYWNESNGKNHLIFNMIPGSFPDYNTRIDLNLGDAIIAGGGFDTTTFRQNFDISIPVYSSYSKLYENRFEDLFPLLTKSRNKLLVITQMKFIPKPLRKKLSQIETEHPDKIISLSSCNTKQGSNESNMFLCNEKGTVELEYLSVLQDADFCLVMKTAVLGQPLLSDVLMSACIPVIMADGYVLPFEDKVDWNRFSLRIYEHSLSDLMEILKSFSERKVQAMKKQTLYIWQRYFSSMKAIGTTTFQYINERLLPQITKGFESWNFPFEEQYSQLAIINSKLTSKQIVGFTAVILTYDRLESLFEVIIRVAQVPSCVKVIIIWNNQRKKPPHEDRWPKINLPLKVIPTQQNILSNRFYPYEDIATDAILAFDDDITMLTIDELEFGYQVWKEFPDRIVGFPSRVHRWDNTTYRWKYESEWTNDVSMVLTGAAFYHKVL